jgi:hypothetical protein
MSILDELMYSDFHHLSSLPTPQATHQKMFSILDKRFFCKDETVKDEENCDIIKKNKIQLRFYIFSILINNDTLIKLLKNYRKSPLLKI